LKTVSSKIKTKYISNPIFRASNIKLFDMRFRNDPIKEGSAD